MVVSIWLLDLQLPMQSGADPGFGIRGGVSRRGIWGPLKVPSVPGQRPFRGSRGAKPLPLSSGGLRNYRHLFERQF
jgi:hypothetical protein